MLNALVLGLAVDTAAACGGVTGATLYREMEKDADFRTAVELAIARSEQTLVAMIFNSAKAGQWQAAAWILERRFNSRWGRKNTLWDPTPEDAKTTVTFEVVRARQDT